MVAGTGRDCGLYHIYRVLETLVVLRNVRDSRFRREPYRKRKRASTYISPIHAERPTNDAVRVRARGGGMRGREDEGSERVGVRGDREGCGGYRGKKRIKRKKGGKKPPRKREKAGRGPRAATYLCNRHTIKLWNSALEGNKGKNENRTVHTRANHAHA